MRGMYKDGNKLADMRVPEQAVEIRYLLLDLEGNVGSQYDF